MESRFSRICDAIIEAGWLAALVLAPLFFNTFSNRVFEPDKIHLVRSIALLMAVAWLVQLLDSGLRRPSGASFRSHLRSTPLVLPTLILVGSYLISTALSVIPRISFFGSYVRMQGTFSFLSYVTIFALVLTHLRTRAQINRLLHTVILTSLPIAIYGIIQKAGLDSLPWGGDVIERVAANMGNAIFVAAYLIMAVFLTLERLLDSLTTLLNAESGTIGDAARAGSYMFILIVQLIAIVFTQSRGPWLGLAAGLYVFAMLGLLLLARWATGRARVPVIIGWLGRHVRIAWFSLIGIILAGLIFLVTLNVPSGPLQGVCDTRYINRLCTLFSTTQGTNAVRALIWEGVVDMMLKPHAPIATPDGRPDPLNVIRPLVGYGPESMWVAYNRFYPPELAHYEARNASPDRSHNETFDTLERGGLLQFAAQIFLYLSVFYYALRQLGLMRERKRRNLFIASLVTGGSLGVALPLIFDGSLRLAGIGLPAGLIAGVIVYVTLDLLLGGNQELAEPASSQGAQGEASGRRQLLILAVLSAIVAHFFELHFGIAIVSTLTHFWVLAALLVVVGMRWDEPTSLSLEEPAPNHSRPAPVASKTAAALPALAKHKSSRQTRAADHRAPASPPRSSTKPPLGAQQHEASLRDATARNLPSGRNAQYVTPILPYVVIGGMITMVLVWNYLVNQSGATNPLAMLWDAFTTRTANYQIVSSPMLLVMMLFVWLIGGLLAAGESKRQVQQGSRFSAVPAALIYAVTVVGVFFLYGLIQAGRLNTTDLSGLEIFQHLAGHIAMFDAFLLLALLSLAAAIVAADPRPRPAQAFGRSPALTLGSSLLLTALALWIIVDVNIQTVQADTYYKQGLSYESAGQWEGAVVLYREAALLEPQEDYYYLFLGRSLLQLATTTASTGNAVLPDNLSQVPTGDLLALVTRGVQARNSEDLMRAAQAALVAAQRLNPLNTDHTANLARLQRAWAFANVPNAAGQGSTAELREMTQTQAEAVDAGRLERSIAYYRQALTLSPQSAVLWNELATVQLIVNNLTDAQTSLDRSLALDQSYYPTYILRGDLSDLTGDVQGALEAYRTAAQLAPNDINVLSELGVFSAQNGDTQGALDAFRRLIEVETKALNAIESQLRQLDAIAGQAGGYSRLQPGAKSRQGSLQTQAAGQRAQLHLSYRNLALVLRDAGEFKEALAAAQEAATYASETQRQTIENLISDLQKRLAP